MRLLKEALGVLGALVVIAVIVAFIAPKRTHAVVAALVQIVPGTTTHVGQNESQLVSLFCEGEGVEGQCFPVDGTGNLSRTAYTVPAGYTLIVSDYQFWAHNLGLKAGQTGSDSFQGTNGTLGIGYAIADEDGVISGHEHYASGIRVSAGTSIIDYDGTLTHAFAYIQGYLVPND